MSHSQDQSWIMLAVDCVIFGLEQNELQVLLMPANTEQISNSRLPGEFLQKTKSLEHTAKSILERTTGLKNAYMESLKPFDNIDRLVPERVIRLSYFFLVNVNRLESQAFNDSEAEWFLLNNLPDLAPDHLEMIESAMEQLRYSATRRPVLFELLEERFTLPELFSVYERVYERKFDVRNFTRKFLSKRLLVKQDQKSKLTSKKGAYYYKLDHELCSLSFTDYGLGAGKVINSNFCG